jgi:hypothetical protein
MSDPDSEFYVSLVGEWTAERARKTLERLANDSKLRAEIRNARGAKLRKLFLKELGVDLGYYIDPNFRVQLPPARELKRFAATLAPGSPGRFKLDPFGAYVVGQRPYIAMLLLAARASSPP